MRETKTAFPPPGSSGMRESMARLTPRFSADRTVREYTEERYLPAAKAYRERSADKGKIGTQMVEWQSRLEQKWAALHFGDVKVEAGAEQHVFEVQVVFGDLDPNDVRVELYAEGVRDGAPVLWEMKRVRQLVGKNGLRLSCRCAHGPPSNGLYGGVIPNFGAVAVPLEDAHVLWQR